MGNGRGNPKLNLTFFFGMIKQKQNKHLQKGGSQFNGLIFNNATCRSTLDGINQQPSSDSEMEQED